MPCSIAVLCLTLTQKMNVRPRSGATNLGITRTMGGCPIRQRVDASDGWSGSSPPRDSFSISCVCNSTVECQPSKLIMWVRLPSDAPFQCQGRSLVECHSDAGVQIGKKWSESRTSCSALDIANGGKSPQSPTFSMRTWYISSTPICQVGLSGGSTHRSLHFPVPILWGSDWVACGRKTISRTLTVSNDGTGVHSCG